MALDFFSSTNVTITEDGAADIRILGLTLLCRTLSNLQGALILLREKRIVEARTLARSCYENQFWVLGLVKEGEKFRRAMLHDAMRHKTEHAQTIFDIKAELQEDVEERLREWMRKNKKWTESKTLNPKGVALRGVDRSYIFYQHLTLDAHPSIDTLSRYYERPDADGRPGIDVEPLSRW